MPVYTYSRGFFFGPGFPLGFGGPSAMRPAPLFAPGFGPGMPLFLDPFEGTLRLFPSAVDVDAPGTGVALDSEAASFTEGPTAGRAPSSCEELDEAARDGLTSEGCGDGSNRARSLGLRRSLIILLFLEPFVEILFGAGDNV